MEEAEGVLTEKNVNSLKRQCGGCSLDIEEKTGICRKQRWRNGDQQHPFKFISYVNKITVTLLHYLISQLISSKIK